jgi:competence protein ComEC
MGMHMKKHKYKSRKNRFVSVISIILIGVLYSVYTQIDFSDFPWKDNVSSKSSVQLLQVHFLDVGQADSILLQQGEDVMLIDGGNNADAPLVVEYIKNHDISSLKYVVGTHPHEDHIGGLDAVIQQFDVQNVWMPKVSHTTKTYRDVLQAVKEKGLKITAPTAGSTFELGAAQVHILAPNSDTYEELNNYSIVLKVTYGSTSFLFTGDAEALSEQEILQSGFDVSANVLKIGHHGSRSSTSIEFLQAVKPTYGVICVGKDNKYGHPHKQTLELLQQHKIDIFRTDTKGTILAESDGQNITWSFAK